MKQVLCTIPNASENISGFDFHRIPEGMLSDPMDDDDAERFMRIEGFVQYHPPQTQQTQQEPPPAPPPAPAPPLVDSPKTETPAPPPASQEQTPGPAAGGDADKAPADELAMLRDEAVKLGITVHGGWKETRLRAEIEEAKKSAKT